MSLPWSDSLETVEAVHSFLESWALWFFAAVVVCDVILKFPKDEPTWNFTINERRIRISLRNRVLTVTLPGFTSPLSLKRLLGVLSLLGFGLAILFEIAAFPYSERIISFSNQELSNSQKQIVASLQKSIEAMRGEEELRSENLKLEALVQPRSIPLAERIKFRDVLRKFKCRAVSVQVDAFNDEEAFEFAIQIRDTIRFSGLSSDGISGPPGPTPSNGRWYNPPVPTQSGYKTGVEVEWGHDDEGLGRKLESALKTIGGFKIAPPDHQVTGVVVVVLPKPLPDEAQIKAASSTNEKK